VHLEQSAGQREPNAQSALGTVHRPGGLGEEIEDVRQRFGRHADARIPHPEHGVIALLLESEPDVPTRVGVFGGVVQQVHHHLFQSRGIGVYPDRFGGERNGQVMLATLDQGLNRLHGKLHNTPQLQPFLVEPNLAGGNAGNLQEVIHETRQLTCLTLDDGAGLSADRVFTFLMTQQVYRVQDRSKGVAQFVREHGQELVLAVVQVG
jgi:hypothetical protein